MADITAPILKTLMLPSVIDLSSGSKSITAKAEAVDNDGGSGVDRVVLYFDKNLTFDFGSGSNITIGTLFGTDTFSDSTPFTASNQYTLTKATNPGTYNIEQVWVYDKAGNLATYSATQLNALGINTGMAVVGSVADTKAPALKSLILPAVVDLSSGTKSIVATAEALDNEGGSGVDRVVVYFDKNLTFDFGSGANMTIGTLFGTDTFSDSTPSTASNQYTLTKATNPGTYNIEQVWVYDKAGNLATYSATQLKALGINTGIAVVGSMADTKAPTLKSLSLPPVIDLSAGSKVIIAKAEAVDNDGGSGVDRVVLYFDKSLTFDFGSGSNLTIGALFATDTFSDNTPTSASNPYTLTKATNPGTYNIEQAWVYDKAGNLATYSAAQLKTLGITTTFAVSDGKPVAATASYSAAVVGDQLVVSMSSSDLLPTSSNRFEIAVAYDATQGHFSSLGWKGASGFTSNENIAEIGKLGNAKISGAVTSPGEAAPVLQVFLKPAALGGYLGFNIESFSINGKAQSFQSTAAGTAYIGSANAERVAADGVDLIDGGGGIDVAVFSGGSANYKVQQDKSGFTVTGPGERTSSLANVERIAFPDKAIALDADGSGGQVYRLYQAAFDRKPDLEGVGFWIHARDTGTSLESIAKQFIGSTEFARLYGESLDNRAFLSKLYNNILHRAPDADGFNWWLNSLDHGLSRERILVDFSESPENTLQVIGSIQHGFEYKPWLG